MQIQRGRFDRSLSIQGGPAKDLYSRLADGDNDCSIRRERHGGDRRFDRVCLIRKQGNDQPREANLNSGINVNKVSKEVMNNFIFLETSN